METHDFKFRLCGTKWLNYVENNTPCPSLSQEDGRHNFDFSKPIKVDPLEKQTASQRCKRANNLSTNYVFSQKMTN